MCFSTCCKKVFRYEYGLKRSQIDNKIAVCDDKNQIEQPPKRNPMIEWYATDHHFQGRLVNGKGKRPELRKALRKNDISRDVVGPFMPDQETMRAMSRRAGADIYNVIENNPFKQDMRDEEKQKLAKDLVEFSSIYVVEMMSCYYPNSAGYSYQSMKDFGVEMTKLAMAEVAYRYYGRDLTPEELKHIEAQSKAVVHSYFPSTKEGSYERRENARAILTEKMKKLSIPKSVLAEYKRARAYQLEKADAYKKGKQVGKKNAGASNKKVASSSRKSVKTAKTKTQVRKASTKKSNTNVGKRNKSGGKKGNSKGQKTAGLTERLRPFAYSENTGASFGLNKDYA